MTSPITASALLAITLIAAITDLRSGLIPNWLTLPALLLAPAVQLVLGGTPALLGSALGALSCGLVPLGLFRAGAMGGGDVKLLVAIGALAGPLMGLELQLIAYNALVVFALIALALRGRLTAVLRRAWRLLRGKHAASADPSSEELASFRLGAPIFVATLARLALEAAR